jgi:hypothetical protein
MVTGRFKLKEGGPEMFASPCLGNKCQGAVIVPYEFKMHHAQCNTCSIPYRVRLYKKGYASVERTDL